MAMDDDKDEDEAKAAEREARVAREARAECYLQEDLNDQRGWYSRNASRFKARAQQLSLAVLAAGALTTFVQAFGTLPWVPVVTAFLGGLVVLAEGWQRIARYNEDWAAYRLASERMKREHRLYVNGAGEYRDLADEQEVFLRFIENVEAIIAEEQQIFWRHRGGEPPSGRTPPRETAPAEDGERP
jgi:hypothetical protein